MAGMIGKALVWTVAALALVLSVLAVTLHREGLFALPGQTIVVHFHAGTRQEDALAQVAEAGAALIGYGNSTLSLRLRVIDPAAPRRLANAGLVYRDPFESLRHCFGASMDFAQSLKH
ncbi:MAG: hypothetical protein LAT56_04910 [Wenzhouxiangella sp.]|nr:hypothetical protein [Wenzhouxiangella sp.]